jgi:hypothetical protein
MYGSVIIIGLRDGTKRGTMLLPILSASEVAPKVTS